MSKKAPLTAVVSLLALASIGCESHETAEIRAVSDAGEHDHAADSGSHRSPMDDGGNAGTAGSRGNAGAGGEARSAEPEDDAGQADVVRGSVEAQNNPEITDRAYAEVIEQLNVFGLELGRRCAEDDGLTQKNSVYSPLSASIALSMTYAGARGKTADELEHVLSGGIEADVYHAGVNRLARELASRAQESTDAAGSSRKIELNISDAIFVDKSVQLQPSFLDLLSLHYDSGVHLEDFRQAPEQARLQINDWVADRTHDRIQDLLIPGSVTSATRLVLVNALYFYGSWAMRFEASATRDADFHTFDNKTVRVPTMHKLSALRYREASDFVAVDLPYVGDHLSMFVVLPKDGQFENVRKAVSAAWLKAALDGATRKDVSLALPKVKMTVGTFQLTKSLIDMGITAAFSGDADFSGITGQRPLAIDSVVQKAFIAVDESGTEAAAATAVTLSGSDAAPTDFVSMNVDRPFLFFIHDSSGAVLFSGHVVDPSITP